MKKRILISTFIIIAMIFTVTSRATTSDSVSLKISKDNIKAGETFTVTLSATSESGLNGIEATMEYDEDILEVTESKLADSTNWAEYDSFPKIVAMWKTSTEDTNSANIYIVTFKVKDDVTAENANIKLTGITLSNNSDEVSIEDITKTLNIVTEEISGDDGSSTSGQGTANPSNGSNSNNNGNNGNSGSSSSGNSGSTTQAKVDTSTSSTGTASNTDNTKTSLPYTGIEENIVLIATIVAISIFGIVSYNLYKKYRNI